MLEREGKEREKKEEEKEKRKGIIRKREEREGKVSRRICWKP
jgi:hypothetical protein